MGSVHGRLPLPPTPLIGREADLCTCRRPRRLAALLADVPGPTVLVTSRAPLNVRGEWRFQLLPLAVPSTPTRSRRRPPSGCSRPGPRRRRRRPERQQTLRAMLDWNHELLGEPERVVFRRLAAFAGGATLPAVEAMCGRRGRQVAEPVGGGRIPVVGANAEIRWMEEMARAGAEGDGSLVLVEGPVGIGKTDLLAAAIPSRTDVRAAWSRVAGWRSPPTATARGGGPGPATPHRRVARIASHQPGSCSTRSGRRTGSSSAARCSASINSSTPATVPVRTPRPEPWRRPDRRRPTP